MSERGDAYLDIVWRQFKRNRFALGALWALLPLVLVAVYAPLIASASPLIYFDGERTLLPWIRAVLNPDQVVDYLFNMAMLASVPWLILSLALNAWWKRSRISGGRRVLRVLGLAVLMTVLLSLVMSIPGVRPNNRYAARSFVTEDFQRDDAWGLYTPIPYGPLDQDSASAYEGPMYVKLAEQRARVSESFPHILGTDNAGRDVLARMLYGTRISLTIGFIAVGIYLTIGIIMGALAGYFGGLTDIVISRLVEVMMLFPSFFLILTLVAMIGPNIFIIMVVIGITGWPGVARLIRGEVLKQRGNDYVSAARSLGAANIRIILKHVLPNALAPALVAAPFGVASAIVTEAGLSLLGVGVRMPAPTWGILLQLGNGNYSYWWLVVMPSLAIFYTVTVFNLIGSGLRDAMDPRLRA